MKILTNRQFNELVAKIEQDAYVGGLNDGHKKGFEEGHKKGYHKGLTMNKEGVVITNGGTYVFKGAALTNAINGHEFKAQ
jgi:hypothetical protein